MSQESSEDQSARERLRTVTPSYSGQPNTEMDVIGWGIFLILLVLVLPLAPLIVLGWVVWRIVDLLAGRGSGIGE